MAETRFSQDDAVNERSTAQYQCTFKDHTGTAIPSASVTSIKATLIDVEAGTVINSRNAQTVLGANGGTYHATSGLFTLVLGPSDTVITGTPTQKFQEKRLTLDVVYTDGRLTHPVTFYVRSLADITT